MGLVALKFGLDGCCFGRNTCFATIKSRRRNYPSTVRPIRFWVETPGSWLGTVLHTRFVANISRRRVPRVELRINRVAKHSHSSTICK